MYTVYYTCFEPWSDERREREGEERGGGGLKPRGSLSIAAGNIWRGPESYEINSNVFSFL